jgi:hypothetical protein
LGNIHNEYLNIHLLSAEGGVEVEVEVEVEGEGEVEGEDMETIYLYK